MSNEDYLGESLRKIVKGAGFVLIGRTIIGIILQGEGG